MEGALGGGALERSVGFTPVEIGIGILAVAGLVWAFKKTYQGIFGGGTQ